MFSEIGCQKGAQYLSGGVLNLRSRSGRYCVVSFSKTQSMLSTWLTHGKETSQNERKIVDMDVKHQFKQRRKSLIADRPKSLIINMFAP